MEYAVWWDSDREQSKAFQNLLTMANCGSRMGGPALGRSLRVEWTRWIGLGMATFNPSVLSIMNLWFLSGYSRECHLSGYPVVIELPRRFMVRQIRFHWAFTLSIPTTAHRRKSAEALVDLSADLFSHSKTVGRFKGDFFVGVHMVSKWCPSGTKIDYYRAKPVNLGHTSFVNKINDLAWFVCNCRQFRKVSPLCGSSFSFVRLRNAPKGVTRTSWLLHKLQPSESALFTMVLNLSIPKSREPFPTRVHR